MKIDVRYFYGRKQKGVIFFLMAIWCIVVGIAPFIVQRFVKMPSNVEGPLKTFSIFFVIFLSIISFIFLMVGIKRVSGSGVAKNILRNGTPSVGALVSTSKDVIYYQGAVVTIKAIFYYKLPDGRIGKTTQYVLNDIFKKLRQLPDKRVPIKVLGDRAVLDTDKI